MTECQCSSPTIFGLETVSPTTHLPTRETPMSARRKENAERYVVRVILWIEDYFRSLNRRSIVAGLAVIIATALFMFLLGTLPPVGR